VLLCFCFSYSTCRSLLLYVVLYCQLWPVHLYHIFNIISQMAQFFNIISQMAQFFNIISQMAQFLTSSHKWLNFLILSHKWLNFLTLSHKWLSFFNIISQMAQFFNIISQMALFFWKKCIVEYKMRVLIVCTIFFWNFFFWEVFTEILSKTCTALHENTHYSCHILMRLEFFPAHLWKVFKYLILRKCAQRAGRYTETMTWRS
jgi:hypothetical protein